MAQENTQKEAEPKVHVDQEWKEAVAAEKERLRKQEAEKKRAPSGQQAGRRPSPEPTIDTFMAGLSTQALLALGEIENPLTHKREVDINGAAFLIDTIAMLQKKTEGNLTAEESAYLQQVLTELRMLYVNVAEQPSQGEGDRPPTAQG
ncbi:MAG: DUF1844 domain-containing protein [Candidatus Brocadiae bacterium]|nr:DUF1844 domain-containing protein [Candidatus Brocadiia bacterium]